jgi:hypothetical protein
MRVKFTQSSDLISPDVSVTIERVEGRVITYKVTAKYDVQRALGLALKSISLTASSPGGQIANSAVFTKQKNIQESTVISSIAGMRNSLKVAAANSGSKISAKKEVSVQASLNSKTREQKIKTLQTGEFSERKRIIFKRLLPAEIKTKTQSQFSNESSFEAIEDRDSLSYQAAILELVSLGSDVTEAISYERIDKTTRENLSGLIPPANFLTRFDESRQQMTIQQVAQKTQVGFSSYDRLNGSTIAFESYVISRNSEAVFYAEIDRGEGGFTAGVVFDISAIDSGGMQIAKRTIDVSHAQKLKEFYAPKDLVRISVYQIGPCRYRIDANTKDVSIKSCKVFSKSTSEGISGEYEFLGEIRLVSGQGFANFDVDSAKGVIFRAIPVTASGQIFNNASGDVVSAIDLFAGSCSLFTLPISNGVRLQAQSIKGDVDEIEFMRRDLTLNESQFQSLTKLRFVNNEISYEDLTVRQFHVYEYKCRLSNRLQKITGYSNPRFEQYLFPTGEIKISASAPTVQGTSVQFNVSVEGNLGTATQQLYSLIGDFQGVPVFQEKFKQIYTDFSSISLVRCERFNIETGETLNLGLFKPGQIVDNMMGAAQGKFKYRFEALTRAPADLLEELATAESSRLANNITSQNLQASAQLSQTSQDINFTQKFFNKFSLNFGTLSYGIIQAQNHPESSIEQGKTGEYAVTDVIIPQQAATILPIDSRVLPDGRVILSWRASGAKFDHFLVSCTRGGSTFPCGIAHLAVNDTVVNFVDLVTRNFVGECIYSVIPVLSDFSPVGSFNVATVSLEETWQ